MKEADRERRALVVATCALGGVVVAGLSAPFLASLAPSGGDRSGSAFVDVDIAALKPGEPLTVSWRGRPVWILRRTPAQLAALARRAALADPDSLTSEQPDSCRNAWRSIKPEILVVTALCTHLGCSPRLDGAGGGASAVVCPCHASRFDLAGRVLSNAPAPTNLAIPPHRYLDATRIRIGEGAPA
ncbi:ubiquinol-cytochrome c reductase iron-sulfur subunit [Niveibacterium terrae]|uniref:ubiquinol-cytochrome c reductase iron-sulfur subunit n=1 Tax=Niveibacterium terrae TaxID=3373598 RepID=UPI003A920BAC